MSDALDGRLTSALHADVPPARDPLFRVEVLLRLERARFRRRVALVLAVASAAAVLVAAYAPAIDAWLAEDVRRLWIVAFGAVAAMAAAPVMASPGVRAVVSAVGRRLYS